jgi:hypothetical protein
MPFTQPSVSLKHLNQCGKKNFRSFNIVLNLLNPNLHLYIYTHTYMTVEALVQAPDGSFPYGPIN